METFKLNKEETTEYIILEKYKGNALLKRVIANEASSDPTPYIIAHGYSVHNGIIEWSYGNYCKNLFEAVDTFRSEQISNTFAIIEKYLKKYDENFELSEVEYISARVSYNFTNPKDKTEFQSYISTIDILKNNEIRFEEISSAKKIEGIDPYFCRKFWTENEMEAFSRQYDLVMNKLDDILDNYIHNYPSDTLISCSDNISVSGHKGTWYVIDTKEFDGEKLFLLEHEEYGDEAACVIVDGNRNLKLEEVYNGFDDYEEFLESEEMEM